MHEKQSNIQHIMKKFPMKNDRKNNIFCRCRVYYQFYPIISLLFFLLFLLLPIQSLKGTDFDEFDGVYADLDDETYGPIQYKQASIYQYMKFKRGNQK